MNQTLPSVTYPSLKHLLLNRLQAALGLYVPDDSVLTQRQRHISLQRSQDNRRVLYVWAIALQLSEAKNIPALEIATAIATLVRQVGSNPGATVSCDFTVQVVPPGWIHLELTEPAIAAWLQRLAQGESGRVADKERGRQGEGETRREDGNSSFPPSSSASRLFAVQYAHARCCSLVQLAHRQGLITLKEAVAPDPIPWLNSDQKLRFCHPAERALIAQLVRLLDDFYCPCPSRPQVDWEKAALNLSQAFQTFYSCCRIWGEVKNQTIHLAQARLGLVMATQPVLRLLLQDRLGVCAPLEL